MNTSTSRVASPDAAATSIDRLDQLLGQALMVADRWDDVFADIGTAAAITMVLAAEHRPASPTDVPRLATMGLAACIDEALAEVQRWDLALFPVYPDLGRLRALLAQLHWRLTCAATSARTD